MTNTLTGTSLIDGAWTPGRGATVRGIDPSTEKALDPAYSLIDADQLEQAIAAAQQAFSAYRDTDPETRAAFLDRIAEGIEQRREAIIERASQETDLPTARLQGEVSRTSNQLRLFAEVVRSGSSERVRIDPAQPEREPAPRVDIRQRMVPLGPVAVFGASNFPLAFSTAGGDTAAALAAGCPVVFKAHNAHPGTAELVGQAVHDAVQASGLPGGTFSLVYGPGAEIGQQLVADSRIQAVGFTGSRSGGLAIARTASERQVPIPVYAEMSSINPVLVLPGGLGDPAALAEGFFTSVTGSCGQLCTEPGLVFVPVGDAGDRFVGHAAQSVQGATGATMLTPSIAQSFTEGVEKLSSRAGVEVLAQGAAGDGKNAPGPVLLSTSARVFIEDRELQTEVFGPSSLVIRYSTEEELGQALAVMEGQLTATLQAGPDDAEQVQRLLPRLESLAGRILYGGWPTGVEVGHAMVHGGPFPATSDSRTTSVGTLAIERFLRPVAYQSFPQGLLPAPLQDANPHQVPQTIDGAVQA